MSGATIGVIVCSIIWWKFLGGWNVGALSFQGLIVAIVGSTLGTIGEAIIRVLNGAEVTEIFPISLFKDLIKGNKSTKETILKELQWDSSKMLNKITRDPRMKKMLWEAVNSYWAPLGSDPAARQEEIQSWFDPNKLTSENHATLRDAFYQATIKGAHMAIRIQCLMLLVNISILVFLFRMEPPVESERLGKVAIFLGIILILLCNIFLWLGIVYRVSVKNSEMRLYQIVLGDRMLLSDFGSRIKLSRLISIGCIIIALLAATTFMYKMW